jgi:hypothetical protein
VADAQPTTFRLAKADDLADIVAVYNAGIHDRVATFETERRTTKDIAGWLEDGQPLIVADRSGRVLGWARAGAYSDRCVYQGVGEHAVYVHPDAPRARPRPPAPDRAPHRIRTPRPVQTHQPRLHRQPRQPRRAPRRRL